MSQQGKGALNGCLYYSNNFSIATDCWDKKLSSLKRFGIAATTMIVHLGFD